MNRQHLAGQETEPDGIHGHRIVPASDIPETRKVPGNFFMRQANVSCFADTVTGAKTRKPDCPEFPVLSGRDSVASGDKPDHRTGRDHSTPRTARIQTKPADQTKSPANHTAILFWPIPKHPLPTYPHDSALANPPPSGTFTAGCPPSCQAPTPPCPAAT